MEYITVTPDNHQIYQDQFIKLYQQCFSEPPYCENWSYADVLDTYITHVDKGSVIVCMANPDQLIGFMCAYESVTKLTDDIDQMLAHHTGILEFDLNKSIYVSEMAVDPNFRGKGIARALTVATFDVYKSRGLTHYFMRSDLSESKSAPLFIKYFNGSPTAVIVPNTDDEVAAGSQSSAKGFWYGPL